MSFADACRAEVAAGALGGSPISVVALLPYLVATPMFDGLAAPPLVRLLAAPVTPDAVAEAAFEALRCGGDADVFLPWWFRGMPVARWALPLWVWRAADAWLGRWTVSCS
jgi:short-subunit dehydrogenase